MLDEICAAHVRCLHFHIYKDIYNMKNIEAGRMIEREQSHTLME